MPPAQCSGLMSSAHSYFHGQAHLTHLWKTWKQDEIRQNIPSYIKDGHVRRRDYHGQSSLLLLSPFNSFFFVVVFLREETYCCLWVLFSWNRAQTLTQVKCPGAKTNGKEQKIFCSFSDNCVGTYQIQPGAACCNVEDGLNILLIGGMRNQQKGLDEFQ